MMRKHNNDFICPAVILYKTYVEEVKAIKFLTKIKWFFTF